MTRAHFLKLLGLVLAGVTMPVNATKSQTKRAPAFFIGHGSPMNAILDNAFTQNLKEVGEGLEKPKAILMISAHWTPPFYGVTVHDNDEGLMYDFFGFPEKLEQVKYEAPTAEFLTDDLQKLVSNLKVKERPLDHGAWSVLVHLFPEADVPVMQFGIHRELSLREHFELAKKLRVLRDHGVMIIGSGNITHNLSQISRSQDAVVEPWAASFDQFIKEAIEKRDFDALVEFQKRHKEADRAHPTLEHYIPLLYIAGMSFNDDTSSFPFEGMEHGTLSMRNWLLQGV